MHSSVPHYLGGSSATRKKGFHLVLFQLSRREHKNGILFTSHQVKTKELIKRMWEVSAAVSLLGNGCACEPPSPGRWWFFLLWISAEMRRKIITHLFTSPYCFTQWCACFCISIQSLTFSVPRFFSLGRFSFTWRSTRIFCQYLCSWSPFDEHWDWFKLH